MVVTNLPRSERFKKENVILIGIIPGPLEPPLHMNSYLKLMVDELNKLWEVGIQVSSPDLSQPIILKAMVPVIFLLVGRYPVFVGICPNWAVPSV